MTSAQNQQRADDSANGRPVMSHEKTLVSQEQLQHEADYARAQGILESLLNHGFISLLEFNKITALNRESFSPMLAQIMP